MVILREILCCAHRLGMGAFAKKIISKYICKLELGI